MIHSESIYLRDSTATFSLLASIYSAYFAKFNLFVINDLNKKTKYEATVVRGDFIALSYYYTPKRNIFKTFSLI